MVKPCIINKNALYFLLPALILFFIYSLSEASPQDRRAIESLDLSGEGNLIALEEYLSRDNILNYFKVRERLLLFSYEELTAIKERARKSASFVRLNVLLDKILEKLERETIYLLKEDIFVSNMPVLKNSPFYSGLAQERDIAALEPSAEHLYFDNLKLNYKKNNLVKETESLWVNRGGLINKSLSMQSHMRTDSVQTSFKVVSGTAQVLWSRTLREDNLSDYLVSSRQWIKEYEENQLYPSIYKEAVIMRNAYGIFCNDLLSGKGLWSFKYPDNSGSSFYQTFRRPHINMHGYYLIIAEDMLFAELGESLVALSLKDFYSPKLLWKRSLGEYALCTVPVYNKDTVVAGLINARGELWVGAFHCRDGALKWSTYIGTCSFLSPACSLSVIEDGRLFLGTNHGVLASLRLSDGAPIWLREYKPKDYSLFDYWQGHFSEKNLIKYDTQFLKLEAGLIYYKPRESGYLYILDPEKGEAKESILIDSEDYHILKVQSGKGIFLTPSNKAQGGRQIEVIDLVSGRQLCAEDLGVGMPRGVFLADSGEILCKVGNTLHVLGVDADKIKDVKFTLSSENSWLLVAGAGLAFIAEGRSFSCVDISAGEYTPKHIDSYRREYIKRQERVKENLKRSSQLGTDSVEAEVLRKNLIFDICSQNPTLQLEEIFPTIINNLGELSNPRWREFTAALLNLYGEEVVTYRDIEIKFKNFLLETALIDRLPADKKDSTQLSARGSVYHRKDFKVKADKIYPIPIKRVDNQGPADFFLLLNRDQLLCIDEKGRILWQRKIFYRPYPTVNHYMEYITDKVSGRMYADDVEAYLYGEVLVINDRVNIIALNTKDGRYLWSMANKGEAFERAREFPPQKIDNLYKKYGLDREFIKKIMFYCEFAGDRFIIVHGNKVYSLNPLTGYCKYYRELDMEGAIKVAVSGERIYLVSYLLDKIKVLDTQLRLLYDAPLDFIKDKDVPVDLLFVADAVILHAGSDLYVINKEGCQFRGRRSLGESAVHKVESFGDSVLVISPFKKISSYRLKPGGLTALWEFEVASADPGISWKYRERKTRYYFIIDRHILLPFRRDGEFFFVCVNLDTGNEAWEKKMPGVKGFFYDLSDAKEYKGEVNFIMTTGGEEISLQEFGYYPPLDLVSIFITSKLCSLDLSDGEMKRKEKMPPLVTDRGIIRSDLVETNNCFVYVVNGKLLVLEGKHI